jgi:cytochrome c oxidase subunit 2
LDPELDFTPVIDRLLPLAASEHAAEFDAVLNAVHVHIAIQAIAWGAFFVYCLIRFRQRIHPQPKQTRLEPALPILAILLVVVGDAVLLATTALPVWMKRATLPSPLEAPFEVRVAAEQFAWNVHYPGPDGRFGATSSRLISVANPLGIDRASAGGADDIGLQNVLNVPVNRPTIVYLTSRDVVHSFTLNEMRVRQDTTPGLPVRTWFTPTSTGRWEISCSQLCGLGHYRMRGAFSVLSADDWAAWQAREIALLPQVPR